MPDYQRKSVRPRTRRDFELSAICCDSPTRRGHDEETRLSSLRPFVTPLKDVARYGVAMTPMATAQGRERALRERPVFDVEAIARKQRDELLEGLIAKHGTG